MHYLTLALINGLDMLDFPGYFQLFGYCQIS